MVSVLLPVFNAEQFVEDCIRSILNQSLQDFELIIVNDGSTDRSEEFIKRFNDPRLKLFSKKNEGIVKALNFGLQRCSGEFIARMDADDLMFKDRLRDQVEYMKKYGLDLCGGHLERFYECAAKVEQRRFPVTEGGIFLSLGVGVPFAHPSVMLRRKFFEANHLQYGGLNYAAEDYDLWVRAFVAGGKYGNVDAFVLRYRVLGSSLSSLNARRIAEDTKSISDEFVNTYQCDLYEHICDLPIRALQDRHFFVVVGDLAYKLVNIPSGWKRLGNLKFMVLVCVGLCIAAIRRLRNWPD